MSAPSRSRSCRFQWIGQRGEQHGDDAHDDQRKAWLPSGSRSHVRRGYSRWNSQLRVASGGSRSCRAAE
jgi:hypothetical protein